MAATAGPEIERLIALLDQAGGEQGRPVNRALAREVLEETADLFER